MKKREQNRVQGFRRGTSFRGFTIIELLVVIAVVAILATIAIVSYNGWRGSVLSSQVKSDLSQAAAAMQSAVTFNDTYPDEIPDSFNASEGVDIVLFEYTDTSFCIDGSPSENPSITFYIDESFTGGSEPQEGTCETRANQDAPAIPTGLAASGYMSASVSLSWDAASGASTYTSQCAYDAAFVLGFQQATQAGTASVLNGFNSTQLYCRVKAHNAAKSSDWSPTITVVPFLQNGLVAWYPFNGNANNAVGTGSDGSVSGASLVYGIDGSANSAYNFDGVDDYIEVSPMLSSYTSFTISAWEKGVGGPSANSGHGYIVHQGTSRNQGDSIYWIGSSGSGYYDGDVSGYTGTTTTTANDVYTWHLVTMTYDGTTRTVYVDGVQQKTGARSLTNPTTNTRMTIGGTAHDSAFRPFKGVIDDVRIYDRALSSTEVTALYNSTNPTSDMNGMVAWYPLNNNADNATGLGNNGTISGATSTTGQSGQTNSAYSFDGVDDYINLGTSPTIGSLVNNLTVSTWFSQPVYSGAKGILSASRLNSANGLSMSTIDSTLRFTTLGVKDYTTSPVTLVPNKWHFMVAVLQNNNASIYLDGELVQTITHTTGGVANTDDNIQIGAGTVNGSSTLASLMVGSIDDLRIYNRVLSVSEIQALYVAGAR